LFARYEISRAVFLQTHFVLGFDTELPAEWQLTVGRRAFQGEQPDCLNIEDDGSEFI